MKRLLATAALAGLGIASQAALAVGTAANTTIANKATINYTVGGSAQTPIESSPGGNTVAGVGAGTNTTFLVDDKIDLVVIEQSGGNHTVTPGQTNVVATFRVRNDGNAPHAFALSAANMVGGVVFGNTDNTNVEEPPRIFVDANNNGTYESGTDVATNIASLAADATSALILVVVDVPLTVTNGQFANVRLTAAAAENNNPANVITLAQATGPDTAGVDFVFADAAGAVDGARDGAHSALDQFAVQSASLTVTKTSALISDPFNNTTNPRAIPGAIVEYTVVVANGGGAAATGVSLSDPIPANTTYQTAVYNAGASDVRITVNGVDSFCVAEAGGADTNSDGCVRTVGGSLQVGLANLTPAGPNSTATVRFRVAIN
jgi:uncharacterized repeat protein (TIGR01451 family)